MFKSPSQTGLISILIIFLYTLVEFGLPANAEAQWHRSDDIEDSLISTQELIIIGLVTVGGILLISQISKSNKRAKHDEFLEQKRMDSTAVDTSSLGNHNEYEFQNPRTLRFHGGEMPINVFLSVNNNGVKGVDSRNQYLSFINKTALVGFSLKL